MPNLFCFWNLLSCSCRLGWHFFFFNARETDLFLFVLCYTSWIRKNCALWTVRKSLHLYRWHLNSLNKNGKKRKSIVYLQTRDLPISTCLVEWRGLSLGRHCGVTGVLSCAGSSAPRSTNWMRPQNKNYWSRNCTAECHRVNPLVTTATTSIISLNLFFKKKKNILIVFKKFSS